MGKGGKEEIVILKGITKNVFLTGSKEEKEKQKDWCQRRGEKKKKKTFQNRTARKDRSEIKL